MEILALFDKDGNRLNKTHIRGEPLDKNEYCMAADSWIRNDKEQILLTQRHKSKKVYPLKWECTSGFIKAGEDSFIGALREIKEEIGLELSKDEGGKVHRIIQHDINVIFDIFTFKKNVDIKKIKLQEDEVIDIKWVSKEELKEMFKRDEMVGPLKYVCELIDKKII